MPFDVLNRLPLLKHMINGACEIVPKATPIAGWSSATTHSSNSSFTVC